MIEYQLTVADLTQGMRAAYTAGLPRRLRRMLALIVIAIVLMLSALSIIYGDFEQQLRCLWLALPTVGPLLIAWFLVAVALSYGVTIPRNATRLFAQAKGFHERKQLQVESDGVRFHDRYSDVLIPWDHVRSWRDGVRHIFLFITDAQCVVVPKRAFQNSPDLDRLQQLLTARARRI